MLPRLLPPEAWSGGQHPLLLKALLAAWASGLLETVYLATPLLSRQTLQLIPFYALVVLISATILRSVALANSACSCARRAALGDLDPWERLLPIAKCCVPAFDTAGGDTACETCCETYGPIVVVEEGA